MKKLIALVIMVLALAACAGGSGSAPAVQRVLVPVPVPCKVTMPDAPSWAVDALPLGSTIWQQMQALRAERLQRQGYESELEAAVRACQ
ncbi:MAG: hypothetical protein CVU73_11185 [Deltaproteobacteria bacterium HGW-Deltaproteobacteria-8]|jgi:ABC-type glycerol-3-phosphate transport system substrate-binding protein|nr:MAG: hypothetical protein CVU73_11185 [Deltaproteobacteria bacterium HGW-Deltaproteobacteria-8]